MMTKRLSSMITILYNMSEEAILAKKKQARKEFETMCYRAEFMVPEEYLRRWWKGTE